MVAVPLVARDRAVAVLYADTAGQDADALNLEAIETLVRVAGMAVELLAARRQPAAGAQPQPAREEQPRREEPRREEPRREEPARPEPAAREPQPARPEPPPSPVFGFEPQPVAAEPRREPESSFESETTPPERFPSAQPEPPPPPAPEADFSRPESFTAAPPAPEPSAQPASPLATSRRYGSMDMDFPVEVTEEEKRYHNEARRFARLLVSEIKLYNEQKVREGRDASDLYERLREDIDRSRQMYDKRVRPEVSSRYDYFDHELVNMLAEGDRNKLGAGYPGATVGA